MIEQVTVQNTTESCSRLVLRGILSVRWKCTLLIEVNVVETLISSCCYHTYMHDICSSFLYYHIYSFMYFKQLFMLIYFLCVEFTKTCILISSNFTEVIM
jgi:hypothetical protein